MKKILVLSDIHGRVDSLRQVLARNSDISLVFVAGDLTNFGGAEAALAVISELEAMECKPRIALVPGNCETLAARRAIESSGHSVDGRLSTMEFCRVAGAGGGLRRAGLTSFEKTESELKASLERALAGLSSSDEELPLFILTHNPPYGTNADRRGESHVGSMEFASVLARRNPAVWICGHIHESPCVSLENETLVVNPGPCALGLFAVIEVKEGPGRVSLAGACLSN